MKNGAPPDQIPRDTSPGEEHLLKALEYARKYGIHVHPLRPNCRTPLIKRTPYRRGGVYAATTDEGIIRQWWQRWPDANMGGRMGSASGLVVLDIDKKKGKDGYRTVGNLGPILGQLPPTVTVSTPNGGEHHWFRMPEGGLETRQGVGSITREKESGLDLMAENSYVVLPPSSTDDGAYEFLPGLGLGETEIAELPTKWVEFLRTRNCPSDAPPPLTTTTTAKGGKSCLQSTCIGDRGPDEHRNRGQDWEKRLKKRWVKYDFNMDRGALWTKIVKKMGRHLQGESPEVLPRDAVEAAVWDIVEHADREERWPKDRDKRKFVGNVGGWYAKCAPNDPKLGCYVQSTIHFPRGVLNGLLALERLDKRTWRDVQATSFLALCLGEWGGRVPKGRAKLGHLAVSGYLRLASGGELVDGRITGGSLTAKQAMRKAKHVLNNQLNPQSELCKVPLLSNKEPGFYPGSPRYVQGNKRRWSPNSFQVDKPTSWQPGEAVRASDIAEVLNLLIPTPELIYALSMAQREELGLKRDESVSACDSV